MISKLTNTYSIVAVDSEREEMGVAVQSHVFSAGSIVPWAVAGVGCVATQSLVNIDFGPQGLALLEAGLKPPAVVQALLATDDGEMYRQLAVASPDGTVAAHTGDRCIREAGHVTGDGVVCAANMMERSTVWDGMLEAFEQSEGALAGRLLAAMEAAEEEGGDIRGKQSAGILVVSTVKHPSVAQNRLVDIRVEDNPDPIREMRRLLTMHTAYRRADDGDNALAAGDPIAAEGAFAEAFSLFPDSLELRYWMALGLASTGDLERVRELLTPVYAADGRWRELTRRLRETGLFTLEDAVWEELTRL